MNETEKDAYMSGYQMGMRAVRAEKSALIHRVDELCAELGRSQLNCDMWHDRAEDMRNRLSAAQAENAKLRELIADVHDALCADKAGIFHELLLASMEDDMRELGIEVDG